MAVVCIFLAFIFLALMFDNGNNSAYTVGSEIISGNQKFCYGEKLHAVFISDNVVKFSVRDKNYYGDPYVYLNAVVQHASSLSKKGVTFNIQNQSVLVTYRNKSQADKYVVEICRIT